MTHLLIQKKWPDLLLECGENGRKIFHTDWSQTSLGRIESWPGILKTTLITCLESRFPIGINWGDELIHFYNDAAISVVEGHGNNSSLGKPISESYEAIWEIIEPMFRSVLNYGHATWVEDQLVLTNRNGFLEETYMTWSYSPVRDENGIIKGTYCSVIETTNKVIGERRLRMLQEMALKLTGKNSVDEACHESIEILKENENDIPYAVLRIMDDSKTSARVAGAFGISVPDRGMDKDSNYHHPALVEVLQTKSPVFVEKVPLDVKVDDLTVQAPKSVYVLPLLNKFDNEVIGFLSVGLSDKRPFDHDYKNFLNILANQISTSIISASAQEKATQLSRGEIKRLSNLLDASPDHVFMMDREGRYVYHNKATEEALMANLILLGRGNESTINQSCLDMDFEPGFLKRFMASKDEALSGKISTCTATFPTPQGLRDFDCILSPMYGDDGTILGVTGVSRDVTDLKQSIKVRDEFLSIASHELKTPLTTLKLQTQMRARLLEKDKIELFNKEKLVKIFQDDDTQINRLNRLIDDMLDASRMNAGQIELHIESIDIKEIVEDVIERLALHLENQEIKMVTNVQSIKGEWDRYRIEQVFTNLLTNAMKYGQKKPIHIETKLINDVVELAVKDEGMGIKKEDQVRIFQQFERAISSSSVSGLGLGLYIVERILKSHGGSIRLESKIHKGSNFIVSLPLNKKVGI